MTTFSNQIFAASGKRLRELSLKITVIDGGGRQDSKPCLTLLEVVEVELGRRDRNGGVGEQDGRSEDPSLVRERLLCLLGGAGGLVLGGRGGVR